MLSLFIGLNFRYMLYQPHLRLNFNKSLQYSPDIAGFPVIPRKN